MPLKATLATLAFLALPAAASAQSTADRELHRIAWHVVHGPAQDGQSLDLLERRYARGETLVVTCGTVSRLAVRRLARLGVGARLVGAVTGGTSNGADDGHIMVEVLTPRGWRVYDLDNNRQPVDVRGRGVTVSEFVHMRKRRYRMLANDRKVSWPHMPKVFAPVYASEEGLERWYDRILRVPTIYDVGGDVIYTPPITAAVYAHMAQMGNYRPVSRARWGMMYRR
jgi:hypothetical protein